MTQTIAYKVLPAEIQHSALLQLLSNSLILCHTVPYLHVADILALAATSRAFRWLIYGTPQVFRRINLTPFKSAQFDIQAIDHGGETWRNGQVDENLTEDDFYSGPLRGIFSNLRRLNILSDVQVLVLDGLSVTADLVHDILVDPSYSVRILSLRDCKHLNDHKLRSALNYVCRLTRPDDTPRLKGLYIFGQKDETLDAPEALVDIGTRTATTTTGIVAAVGATWNTRSQKAFAASKLVPSDEEPEAWYGLRGWQFAGARPISQEWAQTMVACDGLIAFDAVLCAGPRHLNSPAWGKISIDALNAASSSAAGAVPQWSVAQYSLGGCAGCGSAPEGWTVWGEDKMEDDRRLAERRRNSDRCNTNTDIGRFPLLSSPPLHSASIRAAMCPAGQPLYPRLTTASRRADKACFIPRCGACLRDRYCTACHQWWCESCYLGPLSASPHMAQYAGGGVDHTRVEKSCWECGMNCHSCIKDTQRRCRNCGGGYCLIHNEGSNQFHCDWCSGRRGRRNRDLY